MATTPVPLSITVGISQAHVTLLKQYLKPDRFWQTVKKHVPIKHKTDFRWEMAVKALKESKLPVLEELNAHRRLFWTTLRQTLESTCAPFCEFTESGSVAPASDIDVTITHIKTLQLLAVADRSQKRCTAGTLGWSSCLI